MKVSASGNVQSSAAKSIVVKSTTKSSSGSDFTVALKSVSSNNVDSKKGQDVSNSSKTSQNDDNTYTKSNSNVEDKQKTSDSNLEDKARSVATPEKQTDSKKTENDDSNKIAKTVSDDITSITEKSDVVQSKTANNVPDRNVSDKNVPDKNVSDKDESDKNASVNSINDDINEVVNSINNDINVISVPSSSKADNKSVSDKNTESDKSEKVSKLDLDSLISILNTVTQYVSKSSSKDSDAFKNQISEEINVAIDEKLKNSKDGLLNFFNSMNDGKLNVLNVLSNFKDAIKNSDSSGLNNLDAVNSILDAISSKLSDTENIAFKDNLNLDNTNLSNNSIDILSIIQNKNQENVQDSKINVNSVSDDNVKVIEDLPRKDQSSTNSDVISTENNALKTPTDDAVKIINDIKKIIAFQNNDSKVNAEAQHIQDSSDLNNMQNQNGKSSDNSAFDSFLSHHSDEDVLKSIIDDGDKESQGINRNTFFNTMINNKNIDTKSISSENVTIKAENFADDVIKSLKYMQTENLKELTVKINPKNLGEMTIKILQEDGILKAQIKASSKESYDILSRNSEIISKELTNQNVKIQDVNISLNDDTSYFKGSSFENGNGYNGQKLNQGNSKSESITQTDDTSDDEDNNADLISNINMLA